MTILYFIVSDGTQTGPYDVVGLVKKIRGGTITRETLIQQEGADTAKPAWQHQVLADFFSDRKDEKLVVEESIRTHKRGIVNSLRTGSMFLQHNMVSSIYSGLYILVIIGAIGLIRLGLPSGLQMVCYMLLFVIGHFLLSVYMVCVLRMARGQPVDMSYLFTKLRNTWKSLFISSCIVTIPALVGLVLFLNGDKWAVSFAGLDPTLLTEDRVWEIPLVGLLIFVIPGLFTLAIYSLTPWLIVDQGYDFWEAMGLSRKVAMSNGMENSSILYALYIINFFAGILALLPLAISLPLTMGALADVYDDVYGS